MATTDRAGDPIAAEIPILVRKDRHSPDEMDRFLCALSHDMAANGMLLEHCFSRLKRSLERLDRPDLHELLAHVELYLRESKRFLDDMLFLARTGSIPLKPERVAVDEVLGEVLCEQRELLSARGVDVQVQRPLAEVWCNRQRLKQVLTNLLRNAAKHGCDRVQPRVAISTQQRGDRSSGPTARSVVIRLWDNGPGIESRFHEEIFLPGRRLSPSDTEGTGMGLAIVKTIVEHYGGTVAVDPNGPGTAFVVQLPSPPEQARRSETGTFATDAGPGIRIGSDPPHEDQRPHRRQIEGQRWRPVRRR